MNITREQWLNRATRELAKRFKANGLSAVPTDVKISCGFPGGGSARKRIGECWTRAASSAGVNEVFINPIIEDKTTVLAILAHELCHAIDDCKSGHGAPFAALARGIGLEGKMTATVPGEDFKAWAATVKLGDFPHRQLNLRMGKKNKSGRRITMVCRTTGNKWLVSQAGCAEMTGCPFCGDDCHTTGEA